jgi:hypothetical protein
VQRWKIEEVGKRTALATFFRRGRNLKNCGQNYVVVISLIGFKRAKVAELADAPDLGSGG